MSEPEVCVFPECDRPSVGTIPTEEEGQRAPVCDWHIQRPYHVLVDRIPSPDEKAEGWDYAGYGHPQMSKNVFMKKKHRHPETLAVFPLAEFEVDAGVKVVDRSKPFLVCGCDCGPMVATGSPGHHVWAFPDYDAAREWAIQRHKAQPKV